MSKLCKEDPSIIGFLSSAAFNPCQDGVLRAPCDLYDPNEASLRDFFRNSSQFIHTEKNFEQLRNVEFMSIRFEGIPWFTLNCITCLNNIFPHDQQPTTNQRDLPFQSIILNKVATSTRPRWEFKSAFVVFWGKFVQSKRNGIKSRLFNLFVVLCLFWEAIVRIEN